jgi:hypothetical protein
MTRDAIKRLLITSGLVTLLLILTTGTLPQLHAAPPSQPGGHPRELPKTQDATIEPTQVTSPSVTAPVLTITPTLTATETMTTPPTLTPATARAPFESPIDSPVPSPTYVPSVAATPTPLPTPTPTPTQMPPHTATPTVTGTPIPTPIALSTPSPLETGRTFLAENPLLAVAICLIPMLIVGLLLILGVLWRKKPQPPPASQPPPPLSTDPYLESIGTTGQARRLHLKPDGVTIGQAEENDLVITQDFARWETVSRRHARIYVQGNRWIVEDLHSMNGTYVNGRRTGRNLLCDGWRLSVGGVEFAFHTGTGEDRQ